MTSPSPGSAKVDGLQVNPFYVYQAMYWTKAN